MEGASGGLGAVLFADVIFDDRLELFSDTLALQRDGLTAIDVPRRHWHLVGARQADADIRVLRFARTVHHAAHYGDPHLLHPGIDGSPDGHLRPQIRLDALRELLEVGAGGAPAPGARAPNRRDGAQAHGLQQLLRNLDFA